MSLQSPSQSCCGNYDRFDYLPKFLALHVLRCEYYLIFCVFFSLMGNYCSVKSGLGFDMENLSVHLIQYKVLILFKYLFVKSVS